jgi:branched-chain amino acid transport system substrate-binding protein
MWRKARVRAAALGVCAAAFCSAGVSSCGSTGNSSVTASGTTLSIYLSVPPGGGAQAQDVIDAEQLAFQQTPGASAIGKYQVRLVKASGAELSDNARTAIQNTGAVAYLGETDPGASAQSLGITNAQDLLQVSPTDTALELTQSTPAISNTPNRYYESLKTYNNTFARVVPSTAVEAKAQAQEMHSLGVTKLYVANDASPYGQAIAYAVKTAAPASSITISPTASGADAMFYGGDSAAAAAKSLGAAAQANPSIKLFGPSALDTPAFAAAIGATARDVFISSPGFLPKELPAPGKTFVSDFRKTYGHAPSGEAIFGYAAMQAVLQALKQAGASVTNRATVVKQFLSLDVPSSVLGAYKINSNGDTSLTSFVFSRLRGGALVPFTSVTPQG